MKTLALLIIVAGLLIAAGCTTPATGPGATATTTPAAAMEDTILPQGGHTTIGSGNKTIDVSIDSFEVGAEENGKREITVYVAAHNTGTEPVMLVWFSNLTDLAGTSYGGIGISHDGSGARTRWILPNGTEAARDYVTLTSNQELALLSKGARLDVYFMEKADEYTNISATPDYHVAWTVDPGSII